MIRQAVKLLKERLKQKPLTEEEAEDNLGDVELLALKMRAAARNSIKTLRNTRKKVRNYLKEVSV